MIEETPVVAEEVQPPSETEEQIAARLKRESDEKHDREREEKLRKENIGR